MPELIDYYLQQFGDTYRPIEPKPELQQWDNYQIHSLYCVDVNTRSEPSNAVAANEFNSFLAVQSYSINGITFDFDAICQQYP